MVFQTTLYIEDKTPVHSFDARLKVALLLAYSVLAFFADSWIGLAVFTFFVVGAGVSAHLPWGRVGLLLVPVFVLAAFALFFNVVNAADFSTGVSEGALVGLRMLDLCLASFVVCFTTTSSQLIEAFSSLAGPLRKTGFPVDDAAFALSLALRFIPLVFEQFERVRTAQASRSAAFDRGSLFGRVCAWGAVFVPLFVGLFRRADAVAIAMDSRCYGAAQTTGMQRTSLHPFRAAMRDITVSMGVLAVLLLAAILA